MSNTFSFVGTLARDAEVKFSQSDIAILSFSAANNIGYGDKKQTLWIRVTVFGKRAEGQLKDFLKKGTQVFVSGELSQNEYKANDGTTKTSLELVANVIDLVGKRPERDDTPVNYFDDDDDDSVYF
jgi:single-strand DNA-binding protein